MPHSLITLSKSTYRFLLRLYPSAYRREFASEMEFVFSQQLVDSYRQSGESGVFFLWMRTSLDALKSLLVQHLENTKKGVSMKTENNTFLAQNKDIASVFAATAAILLVPMLGRWDWSVSDFVIMALLVMTAGFGMVFVKRTIRNTKYRLALLGVVLFAALWLYVELAVGLFTNWGS